MASPGPIRRVSIGLLLLALASCGAQPPPAPACLLPSQESFVAIDLYFGRAIGRTGRVTDSQWAGFVTRIIAPRFPAGFTIIDSAGAWRDPTTGLLMREPGKLVRILAPPDDGLADRVQAVARAYKRDFAQQAVGIVTHPACASF